ncbi:MAG: polysaccharide biosynthesis protein, partial [Clostridia bacterium]|nr:polysaccharide biosynthesis protein [Clostridia bacterium]
YSFILSTIGVFDCIKIAFGVFLTAVVNIIVVLVTKRQYMGLSALFLFMFFLLTMTIAVRLSKRVVKSLLYFFFSGKDKEKKRVMIVGAGEAGLLIINELQNSDKTFYKPVCAIDDDLQKVGKSIREVKIVGTSDEILKYVEEYKVDEIFVTMPSAPKKAISNIINKCKNCNKNVKILPGIYQLASSEVTVSKLRDVDVQDLLGREQIKINYEEILGYIEDKVVLVSGGGGSIGSELCRQIASHSPKLLIILDIYENNAYEIEQELRRKYTHLNLLTLIASVRDKGKMEDVFKTYRPQIVFHAAAHKHVPLMETSPNEAVKNNVFGTLNIAKCSDKYQVETFVQISTDKAVNPTNVMGATKRICEMIVQTIGKKSKKTKFVAVRFGNVLGSNGSVIPLFKKQIAEGGPVTITHKDIIRYFMTIPEAVSLVLQAGAYAKGGQIFVLDMGEPVRIYDLAYNLIKFSGLEPNVDIDIICTGLRPGEKLYEERLMAEEGLQKTENGLINIAQPIPLDEAHLWDTLDKLYTAAYEETDDIKSIVREIVPTYKK